jgi:hypothetical protein
MRCENNSAVLLEGDRGLTLVHHLQLRADGVEHDLAQGKGSNNIQQSALAREKKRRGKQKSTSVGSDALIVKRMVAIPRGGEGSLTAHSFLVALMASLRFSSVSWW